MSPAAAAGYACPECGEGFGSPEELGGHLERHREAAPSEGRRVVPCPRGCGRLFAAARGGVERRSHAEFCDGSPPLPRKPLCSICGRRHAEGRCPAAVVTPAVEEHAAASAAAEEPEGRLPMAEKARCERCGKTYVLRGRGRGAYERHVKDCDGEPSEERTPRRRRSAGQASAGNGAAAALRAKAGEYREKAAELEVLAEKVEKLLQG